MKLQTKLMMLRVPAFRSSRDGPDQFGPDASIYPAFIGSSRQVLRLEVLRSEVGDGSLLRKDRQVPVRALVRNVTKVG